MKDRIREIRAELGVSQAELGRRIGVTRSAISQLESGTTKSMNGEHLAMLSRVSGYSPTWIATGRGPKRMAVGSGAAVSRDQLEGMSLADLVATIDNALAIIKARGESQH